MAFQEYKPGRTIEDILGDSAQNQVDRYRGGRLPGRNSKISELAATGRLSSGVAQNTLDAYDHDTNLGEGDIRAGILQPAVQAQVGADTQNRQNTFVDEQGEKEFQRNMSLARMLGDANRPSTLSQIFGGIGSAAQLAGGVGSLMAGNPTGLPGIVGGVEGLSGNFQGTPEYSGSNSYQYRPYKYGPRKSNGSF